MLCRVDVIFELLFKKTLIRAHRVQLEFLFSIHTEIQAFLHPSISLSQSSLIEILLYKRCRNLACQNQLGRKIYEMMDRIQLFLANGQTPIDVQHPGANSYNKETIEAEVVEPGSHKDASVLPSSAQTVLVGLGY